MRLLFPVIFTSFLAFASASATPERYRSGIPVLDTFLASPAFPADGAVVGMTGFYGQDQPREWLILVRDGEVLIEYALADGEVIGKRVLRPLPGQDLPVIAVERDRLKVDSDAVFLLVEDLARIEGVGYDSVHYQLRCRDQGNEPVWMVNLLDPSRKSVGIHYVSALSGRVLRSVWHDTGETSMTRSRPGYLYGGGGEDEMPPRRGRRILQRIIEPVSAP